MKSTDGYERVYLGGDFSEPEIRQEIEAVLKRNSAGFLKTVGYWTPQAEVSPQMAMYQQQPPEQYSLFQRLLRDNYNLRRVELTDGWVPGEIDVLLLVAPQNFTDKERLTVDQFLMRGGSVIALAGNYSLDLTPYSQSLAVKKIDGGIKDLLAHYGVTVGDSMVMDMQNEPFPIPVERDLGGITVQEIRRMDYPFFVDVRRDGMNSESPAVSNLPAITLNYVSPLTVDAKKTAGLQVTPLLHSSVQSWLSESTAIQPDFNRYPDLGFPAGESMESHTLAVALKGSFSSYFMGRPDPRAEDEQQTQTPAAGQEGNKKASAPPPEPIIDQSPDSSRLVVVGSSDFIHDTVLGISRSLGGDRFLNNLGFLQNLVDWSVADEDLLAIRARGSQARLLAPMSREEQAFWEWLNYCLALAALLVVSLYAAMRRRREKPMQLV